jgi:adenine-specific DNA-methyltransferase
MNARDHRIDTKLSAVRKVLGEPAYRRDGVLLYQMDCTEAMKRLPGDLFDLTVTSPPYNIGKEYETIASVEEYVAWCARWIESIARLSGPRATFWLNVGYLPVPGRAKGLPIPYLLWDKVPMFLVQEVVWSYGAGVAARKSYSPRNEKFLWYVKNPDDYTFNLDEVRDPNVKYPNQKKNGKLKCNPLGKNPTDVWEFAKVTSGANRASAERTPHPAQFPVAVIDRIVRASSNAGDFVLDPFMGSGTTAEVALATGRAVVGFELNPRYLEVAATRLDNHHEWRVAERAQQTLSVFEEQPKLAALDFG